VERRKGEVMKVGNGWRKGSWEECQMPKTFKDGAVCPEEMLDRVVCSSEQFSFQVYLESGDSSGTFSDWRREGRESCFGVNILLM